MRIHTRPFQTIIDSEVVTMHQVKLMGRVPGLGIIHIAEDVGLCHKPEEAGRVAGEYIKSQLDLKAREQVFNQMLKEHRDPDIAAAKTEEIMRSGRVKVNYPQIPGVTTEGTWKNPSFGNREEHRARHGMKARDERARRHSA